MIDSILEKHMSKEIITVPSDKPIMEARSIMEENKIRRLPVIEDEEFVGIVTEGDIQEAGPSDATSLSIWEMNYLLAETTVGEIMTKEVYTISPDHTLEEAASIMRENKIAGLPIVQDGKLVGLVTESDIFDTIMKLMGFGSEKKNKRITVVTEDKPGTLLKAIEPITNTGGNIISVFSHKDEERNQYEFILRVEAPDIDKTIETMKGQGVSVVDVR